MAEPERGSKSQPSDPAERRRIAADLVTMSAMGAAALTFVPVPLSDFVLVTPIQASMVMSIARVFGREIDWRESKHVLLELASICGVGLASQKGFSTLSKVLLPGLGGVLAGPYAFAVTYAMGHVAMRYFEDRESSREMLRQIFESALEEGRRLFTREKRR